MNSDDEVATSHAVAAARSERSLPAQLVCFSHLRWRFVWQRPQHLLSRAARHYDVAFIEEPVFEPCETDGMRIEVAAPGIEVAVPVIAPERAAEAERIERRLISAYLHSRNVSQRLFWYYTPAAIRFSSALPRDLTVYDNMDELSAFRGASPLLIAQEAELLSRADLVFTGGRSLFEAKQGAHGDIHCFPSSIDAAHFARARDSAQPDPEDQASIGRPRIGFFGVIDERLDRELLDAVAERRPDWQFVMIGPVVKIDPQSLPARPNLHWLGPKPYAALPDYLSHWDAGLMPFARNEATRFISPTKTPEFLAAGLTLVSTPIVDVAREYGDAGLVAIAETPNDVVAALERALAPAPQEWRERVDRHLAGGSWDRTWSAMHALIRDRIARAAPDAAAA